MDRVKLWHQLRYEQQLNCMCDNLAKGAVQRSILQGMVRDTNELLPREATAVYLGGEKMTSTMDKPLRCDLSKQRAQYFLTSELKPSKRWTQQQFDEVAWDWLDKSLSSKPEGYTTWLSKQHTGFCETRLQTARYAGDKDEHNSCPCCG